MLGRKNRIQAGKRNQSFGQGNRSQVRRQGLQGSNQITKGWDNQNKGGKINRIYPEKIELTIRDPFMGGCKILLIEISERFPSLSFGEPKITTIPFITQIDKNSTLLNLSQKSYELFEIVDL